MSLEEPDEERFLVYRYRNSGSFVDGVAACGEGFEALDAALRPAQLVATSVTTNSETYGSSLL